MPSNDTTVRFKADISQLKSEMQAAQRQIKLVNSEFKAATAGMDDFTKSEEGLSAKTKQLTKTLEIQQKKLVLLDEELTKTIYVEGEHSAAADRVRMAINNQQAAIAKTEKELASYNQQLEELPNTTEDVAQATEKAADGFSVFKAALADLIADGIRAGIDALKDFAKEAIQVGMDFESSMSNVQAISGATAEEMQQLNDKAKEMGESTKFSASESADAFGYMAMAGWKTEEMLDGIEGVMNLAAASGADLATTSDIVTDALTAMGYKAKDAGRLADVMAAASSNANTNVEMMGSTFQYVAPVVGALGMSMEDTAVAIGLMANAGIKGEKAGTALRSVLNRLAAPPKQCAEEMEKLGLSLTDSEGKMKSLDEVMVDLRTAFSGLSETEATAAAKHIAGAEAMSGLLAIVNAAPEDYQKLTKAINNSSGAAAEMAETMNDNVGGQLTLLRSKIEGIMIKLFERASDSMKNGIKSVGDALDKVDWNKAGDAVGKFATKAANLFTYIITNSGTIISIVKTLGTVFATIFISNKIAQTASAISTLVTAIKGASSASALLSSAMGALGISMSALPIMAVVGALAALYAYMSNETAQIKEQAQATYGLSKSQEALIDSVNSTTSALASATAARKDEGESIDLNYRKLESMKDSYNSLIDENGKVKAGSEELAQELLGNLANGLGTTVDKINENIDANGKLSASIDELIEKKKIEAKLAAFEDDYNQALKTEVDAWSQLRKAKEEQKTAQETLNEKQEAYNKLMDDVKKMDAWGVMGASLEITKATEELKAAQETYDSVSQTVKDSQNNWAQAQSTIENYDKATTAALNNNVDATNEALNALQGGLVNYGTASKQQLEQQVVDTKKSLDEMRDAYKEGIIGQDVVDDAEQRLKYAQDQLDKFADNAGNAGEKASDNLKGTVGEGLTELTGTVEKFSGDSYSALEFGMGNWKDVAEEKTGDFLGILDGKAGDFERSAANDAQAAADGISSKTSEFQKAADDNSKAYTEQVESHEVDFSNTGMLAAKSAASGADSASGEMEKPAAAAVQTYTQYIASKHNEFNKVGKDAGSEAAKGADSAKTEAQTSGENFAQGFINGIGSFVSNAFEKAKELATSAWNGLRTGQKEGSPSKLTYESGKYFGAGYENGIKATKDLVKNAAIDITKEALNAVKKTQKEGSPSKLTYESGRNFTQGLINGIVSLEGKLVETTKSLVNKTLAELLKLENFNFSDVATNASTVFSSGFQNQYDYMINRINYANQQMIKDFNTTIENLQNEQANAIENASVDSDKRLEQIEAESLERQQQLQDASLKKQDKLEKKIAKYQEKTQTKKVKNKLKKYKEELEAEKKALSDALSAEKAALEAAIKQEKENAQNGSKATKEAYEARIKEQEEMKEAYEQASSSMISEFTTAMQDYQRAAEQLINDTMEGISSKYQEKYDKLIDKQNDLITKLKNAGDLFDLSNVNVMTVDDIKVQTASIKRYASKLEQIKKKVSSELFDQIASYDMKEGEAFIDRLLKMSDKELKAYNDAYEEKLRVSETLGKNTYKSDFEKIASEYKTEMQKAFQELPKQLEDLGNQCMQGFLNGFNLNTDYMIESVKTFVKGMVDEFKKDLGIHSPSKVMKKIGAYTSEGFADGIEANSDMVLEAIDNMTKDIVGEFDWSRLSLIDGFSSAMSEFESKAKETISKTLSNIGDVYKTKFDELLSKQNSLTQKLKGMGELFSISSANVIRMNDVNAQVKEMESYVKGLEKIKSKVSSALFDEITSYNAKEGAAFIKQLLSMSDKELKAYNTAYDKKMSLADQLSQKLYKSDLDKVASDYDKAIESAFKNLPTQLQQLGYQSMQGFLEGLGSNSKYVSDSVKKIVTSVVNTFKTELGIHSPSKVTMQLGELTGEGFADGILKMITAVKEAAREISDSVNTSLDLKGTMSDVKNSIYDGSGAAGLNRNAGSFGSTNSQVFNFNQINNSPKALDRLTIYRQTNNLLFSAKVGLSNV